MDKYNCLIVEDSPMMRNLIIYALSSIKGMSLVEAEDGIEGLKKISHEHFDLIIVDINMPLMDGLKMVRSIRADKEHKDVPVMIITTEGGQEDRERAMKLGVDAYLTKPTNATDVIKHAKRLLKIDESPD